MKITKPEDKIMEAALEVVKKNTISGTRMHLIAEEAQMVQSNLHYYFKTKDELILSLQKRVQKRCLESRAKWRSKAKAHLEDQLEVFIKQKLDFILREKAYDYAELDFWVQSRSNEQIQKNFIDSFEGWRKELGQLLDEYVPQLSEEKRTYLPYMIVSLLEGASLQYLVDEGNFDVEAYFEFCKKELLKIINNT